MDRTLFADLHRKIAFGYFVILSAVAATNYLPIPGLVDEYGRTLGIFALDLYDDLLHLASALWAGLAAVTSKRASRIFLTWFGALYLADGLLGVYAGSGFLDLGICIYGILDMPLWLKFLASLPHIALGGFALAMGLRK